VTSNGSMGKGRRPRHDPVHVPERRAPRSHGSVLHPAPPQQHREPRAVGRGRLRRPHQRRSASSPRPAESTPRQGPEGTQPSVRGVVVTLQIAQPVCLAARHGEDAWRWHARYGHLNLDALRRLSSRGMVHGLPAIEHVDQLCDSCLAGKQRRAPFPSSGEVPSRGPPRSRAR
jgi:hypothetical protein